MRAATIVGPRATAVTGVELPEPGVGEARIRVQACGICGSNLHAWAHPELAIQRDGNARPGAAGHEIAGTVTAVAPDVYDVAVGQQVCVEPNMAIGCGRCAACQAGRAWFCGQQQDLACWGFAEAMIVPARALLRPSRPLPADVLTLAEPLAFGFHALRSSTTGMQQGIGGRHIVVVGAGVAGLTTVAAARALEAGRVTVLARHPHQAAAAKALGADDVIEGAVTAADAQVRALRGDLVLEAVGGTADTLGTSVAAVRRGGEVGVMGLFDEPQTFDARKAVFREIRMYFPVTYAVLDGVSDFRLALDLLVREQQALGQLVTHRLPLDRIDDAFALAADKRSGALRVVVSGR